MRRDTLVVAGPALAVTVAAIFSRQASGGATAALLVVAVLGIAVSLKLSRRQRATSTGEKRPAERGRHSPAPPDERVLFEAILGTMFDGVMVVDSETRLLYVNRSARELLDLGNRSVEGRLFSEALRSLPLETIVDAALHSAQQQHAELVLSRQKLTLAVSASKLALEPSPGVLIVLHDVTDLRRLERMRRDFVSNVSHELKTPLTSIQAYADTLLEGGLEDVDHNRDFVTRIVEQAERLQTLILDILRLARIESVDVGMEIEPIDLLPLIEECVSEREAVSAAKRVELRVDSTLAPIMVRGEAEGLRTIIDNLVDNALNYTPAGGSVTIRTRVEGDEACLSVIDTGVGIPREHQERVFERFYRVDRARSRALGGTGLGLSIVKHLAQTFGGRVELESQPNEGSHFRVWLPLPQTPAEFTAK